MRKGDCMFQVGERIIYGSRGVCEIADVTCLKREGIPEDRVYYVLKPLWNKDSTILTPVDNDRIIMRSLITKDEAEKLISEMPVIEELEVPEEKQREQIYKDCMHTGNCREYIKMIKTLYHRKKVRVAAGKKITSTDERYLKQAEEALYSEFSVLFSIPREKMPEYISEKLSNAG